MKKIVLALAGVAALSASPAAAESFRYNLSGGGFIMIDNVSGQVVLQDRNGNRSTGQGEAFKRWTKDEPFNPGSRCNGICPDHSNKFIFDSISGNFGGKNLSGSALVVGFRQSPSSSKFNQISVWTPRGDVHVSPQRPIVSSSSTSSGGSSSSSSGGSSTSGGSSSGGSSSGSSSGGSSSGGVDVPAPGMLALFGLGAGAVMMRRRRKKAA